MRKQTAEWKEEYNATYKRGIHQGDRNTKEKKDILKCLKMKNTICPIKTLWKFSPTEWIKERSEDWAWRLHAGIGTTKQG